MKSLEYGDLFTIDEFCKLVDGRSIIQSDGLGYYCIGEEKTNELVSFSSLFIRPDARKKGYTGVIWYNK